MDSFLSNCKSWPTPLFKLLCTSNIQNIQVYPKSFLSYWVHSKKKQLSSIHVWFPNPSVSTFQKKVASQRTNSFLSKTWFLFNRCHNPVMLQSSEMDISSKNIPCHIGNYIIGSLWSGTTFWLTIPVPVRVYPSVETKSSKEAHRSCKSCLSLIKWWENEKNMPLYPYIFILGQKCLYK